MRLLVIGAGGHAKVLVDTALAAGHEIAGVVGTAEGSETLLGFPVSRTAEGIDADGFIVGVGRNDLRARHFDEYRSRGFIPASVVHPSAVIGSGVRIGGGTLVVGGVVINVDADIGENVILNTGCTVDHDVIVGNHVLIGPQTALCGGVVIGTGVLLGAGVTAAPLVCVGEWTTVGAGAAVVDDLPAHTVCVGVPARPVRTVEAPA